MTDIGKSAKRAGHLHPRDTRKLPAPEAPRAIPGKKTRKFCLTVKLTRVITETCVKEFTTADAMREFRTRVERAIAEHNKKPPRWGWWGSSAYELRMDSLNRDVIKDVDIAEGFIE